jgi:hypothetical protein
VAVLEHALDARGGQTRERLLVELLEESLHDLLALFFIGAVFEVVVDQVVVRVVYRVLR